jgi:hypothetical protein
MIRDMGTNRKRWLKYELGKTKTKLVIKAYVRQLVSGSKIEWEKLGQMYRPDQQQPVWTFKRLLKQEETQRMVNEEIDKLLSDEGITPKFTIEQRKKVLESAIEKGDLTNANRSLDSFEDKMDMKPKETKFRQITQVDYKSMLQDNYNNALKESGKVTVEKEIAKPEEDKSLPLGE